MINNVSLRAAAITFSAVFFSSLMAHGQFALNLVFTEESSTVLTEFHQWQPNRELGVSTIPPFQFSLLEGWVDDSPDGSVSVPAHWIWFD